MPNRLSTLPQRPPRPLRSVLLLPIVALMVMAGCSSSKSTVASAGGGTTTSAPAANAPVKTMSTSLGTVVVDAATSMTLYHFDKDKPGSIACTGGCATAWPPMTVTSMPTGQVGGGTLAAVTRPDGTQQLTWNGLPLYHFSGDKAPGDTKGDGVAGIWHAATAGAAAVTPSPTTTAPRYGY